MICSSEPVAEAQPAAHRVVVVAEQAVIGALDAELHGVRAGIEAQGDSAAHIIRRDVLAVDRQLARVVDAPEQPPANVAPDIDFIELRGLRDLQSAGELRERHGLPVHIHAAAAVADSIVVLPLPQIQEAHVGRQRDRVEVEIAGLRNVPRPTS